MGSKNFLLMLTVAGVFSTAASAQTTTWNAPTATATVVGDDTTSFQGYSYSNWQWRDPNGVTHSFSGTTTAGTKYTMHPGVDGAWRSNGHYMATSFTNVQASDGSPYYLYATGGIGSINMEGSLYPKFKVLGIVYAPPGDLVTGSKNYVDYGTSNLVGSSFSIQDIKTASVTVSTGTGFQFGGTTNENGTVGGFGLTVSLSGGVSYTAQTDSGIAFTCTESADVTNPGPTAAPSGYAINHDYDRIVLWLNPGIKTFQTSANSMNFVPTVNPSDTSYPPGYNPSVNGPYADIIYPLVGELNGHIPMRSQIKAALARTWDVSLPIPGRIDPTTNLPFPINSTQMISPIYNSNNDFIANNDYMAILKADPYAWDGKVGDAPPDINVVDPNRFQLLSVLTTSEVIGSPTKSYFDYMMAAQYETPTVQKWTVNYSDAKTSSTSNTTKYTVACGASGNWIGGASVKTELTYSDKQTQAISNTKGNFATVSIMPPAYFSTPSTPALPNKIWIYQDNLYGTYMFYGTN